MQKINRNDIYDKNLNFLIGSGASVGILPTLSLNIKNTLTEKKHTVETLATLFRDNETIYAHLLSKYLQDVIKPASLFSLHSNNELTDTQTQVIENYSKFLKTIIGLLQKNPLKQCANIFTTNYDGLIAHVSEKIISEKTTDFVLNDGGSGFIKRNLNIRNFNRYSRDQGVFDKHSKDVPQINLLQPHGSVYWHVDGDDIEISYDIVRSRNRIENVPALNNNEFNTLLNNSEAVDNHLNEINFGSISDQCNAFINEYNRLPIVNPTKWKFHETVFNENYYQILRLLSYELEKPNSVFIVFGFSFADEHIFNLFRRSLSNPTLKVFICCYNEDEKTEMERKFNLFQNVQCISHDEGLNFTMFNEEVLTIGDL